MAKRVATALVAGATVLLANCTDSATSEPDALADANDGAGDMGAAEARADGPNDAAPEVTGEASTDGSGDVVEVADSPDSGEKCGSDATGIPVEQGWTCCPIADAPSCDCAKTGGSPDQPGGCHAVCDAAPIGWEKCVDAHGCPFWKSSPKSCLPPPDVGAG